MNLPECIKLAFSERALAGILLCLVFFNSRAGKCAESSDVCPVQDSTDARPLSFDVVAIKPGHDDGWLTRFTESGFDGSSVPVQYLLRIAFSPEIAPPDILNLPKWAHETYDIHAKVAPEDLSKYKALTREQQGKMLRQVLCDRFKLKFHFGATEHPVYDLVTSGKIQKLEKEKEGNAYSGNGSNEPVISEEKMQKFRAHPDSLAHLARRLSWTKDVENRAVLDRSGFIGYFNFELSWCPLSDRSDVQGADCEGPSLFTALKEQLGLSLKPSTGTFKTVVIDQIDRPSAN